MKINKEKNIIYFTAQECCTIREILEMHIRAEGDLWHFTDKSKELLEKLKLNSELSNEELHYFLGLDDLVGEWRNDSDLPEGGQELLGEICDYCWNA